MVESFIEKKAGGVKTLEMKWLRAWEACKSAGLDAEGFVALAEFGVNEKAFRFLSACMVEEEQGGANRFSVEALQKVVDDSPYGIEDWAGAINRLAEELSGEGIQTGIGRFVGYLACAAEFAASETVRLPFADLVGEMYQQHGFFAD